MSKQKVIRKSLLSNTPTKFSYDIRGSKFLVKNFTQGAIYVTLEETSTVNKDTAIKINSGYSQIVFINDNMAVDNTSNIITIESLTGGEVECQVLTW